jgi:hypothetical protein
MLITKKYTQENLINYKNIELSRDSLRGRVLCKNLNRSKFKQNGAISLHRELIWHVLNFWGIGQEY